jgi:hypothetical protein
MDINFQNIQRRLKYKTDIGNVNNGGFGATGPTGANGKDGLNGESGKDGLSITGPTGPSGGPIGPTGCTGSMGMMGYTGYTGYTGCQGPTGPIGPQAQKHSAVFTKKSNQLIENITDDLIYIDGWTKNLDTDEYFSTDSVHITINQKGTYFFIATVSISNLMTNYISFECVNKVNEKIVTLSTADLCGPVISTKKSTIIHGIIVADQDNFSFKIISRNLKGNVTINSTCHISIHEM